MVPVWLAIILFAWWANERRVDAKVIAGSVLVVGLITNAFAWLLGIVALVPLIGPLIVKVLSIGFIWLLNAIGYLVSFIAIKRGYSQDVLTYRGLTIAVIIGIVVAYFVISMFMDEIPLLLLTLQLTFPLITSLGFDPIWFGVLSMMMVAMGLVFPPVGLIAFVVSATAGVDLMKVYKGCSILMLAIVATTVTTICNVNGVWPSSNA